MAFTYLGVEPGSPKMSVSRGVRNYSRVLKFHASDENDDEYALYFHPSVPRWGSLHPTDPYAYCNDLQISQPDPWTGWQVAVSWSTERELSEDPNSQPAVTDWDGEQFQSVVVFDKDDNAVVNSAGDPFDPPIMRDDSRLISTTVKNMATVPTWIMSYADAVNSDAFTIDGFPVAIGQAKMQRPRVSKQQFRNDIPYREVTFTIHYREDGWKSEPLDQGFREISGSTRVNITDDNDDPISAPVPLNGSGAALAAPTPGTAVFLNFDIYKTLPFSDLPLT